MDVSSWQSELTATLLEVVHRARTFLPILLGAALLLAIGWFVAWLARLVTARALAGLLTMISRPRVLGRALAHTGVGPSVVAIVGNLVYWLVLILFAAAAIERLELQIAATLVGSVAAFLPNVLLAVIIVFGAMLAGQVAGAAVTSAASATHLAQAALLGRATQALIVFLGIVTAADQLGIQSTLLTVVTATVVGVTLGGATLAFGLGSGLAVSNIIAVFYVLKTYRVGQLVRIGGIQGEILEITQTGVVIATPEGRVLVPGRRFSEEASTLLTGGGA
jgi:small-conductance mechanosensitive channel